MGRKPNQLILEFFERGPKLQDSSNRYQHTCKACGEKFPKGRIDSLQHHLLKKCPAITLRDRRKAVLQLHNLPDNAEGAHALQMNGPAVELPHGGRNWTALETLAEVSRQIDLSEKQDDRVQHNNSAGSHSKDEDHPRMDRFELQEQWTPENPPLSYDARLQRDKKTHTQKRNTRRGSEANLPPANFASNMSASPPASLQLTMATATSMAAAASARFVPAMLDPQLLGEGLPEELSQGSIPLDPERPKSTQPEFFVTKYATPEQGAWPMLDGSGMTFSDQESFENHIVQQGRLNGFPRPIAMNPSMTTEFSSEFGTGQKPNRPKVRGRFTATRRKEVQDVRKRGACLRCRMLKKPCSGETPCGTCRRVESARLWKQPCIRTRLADELEMYTAGLHTVLAYREIQGIKAKTTFVLSAKHIETSHYPETAIFAIFGALEGQSTEADRNIDPNLGVVLPDDLTNPRILDNDNDDLPMKIEAYMKRMSATFFDREPSHFMKVTLNTAHVLSIESQDPLLSRVLELWATVHILIDHELKWTISERASMDANFGDGMIFEEGNNYQLICMQLNAAIEKKAAAISKTVLNDLERRLLLRLDRRAGFETFLTTLILLNCVEKSTWLYHSWEQDFLRANWPLDKAPEWYSSQGERITDMLQSLLRVRSVSPKTYNRQADGILASNVEQNAKEYFDKLNLSYVEVEKNKNHPIFDPSDSRCYELRFCSRILLPEV